MADQENSVQNFVSCAHWRDTAGDAHSDARTLQLEIETEGTSFELEGYRFCVGVMDWDGGFRGVAVSSMRGDIGLFLSPLEVVACNTFQQTLNDARRAAYAEAERVISNGLAPQSLRKVTDSNYLG